MAGNTRVLTLDELKYFNDRYTFSYMDNYLLVHCSVLNKRTFHDMSKGFSLKSPVRKITISKDAMKIWKDNYAEEYSLIEVQNAINTLMITYQDVNPSQLDRELKKQRSKYNNTL
jgi:hypothetical protein